MLIFVKNMNQLCFSKLMCVYRESNATYGQEMFPNLSIDQQQIEAEQDFYQYIHSVFFQQKNACFAIWEEEGRYLSALRLEPYEDGLLLCALETAPEFRRRGYAEKLLTGLLSHIESLSVCKIYSHVSKRNTASLSLHLKCGFQMITNYAKHLDGSVFHDSVTVLYENRKVGS